MRRYTGSATCNATERYNGSIPCNAARVSRAQTPAVRELPAVTRSNVTPLHSLGRKRVTHHPPFRGCVVTLRRGDVGRKN